MYTILKLFAVGFGRSVIGILGACLLLATAGAETNPPIPNPMTFETFPTPLDGSRVAMTATTATDADSPPVEYFFTNTVEGHVSGWLATHAWTDTGLTTGTTNRYRVKARDALTNETEWSAEAAALVRPDARLYEPFNYSSDGVPDQNELTGLHGGTGWSNAWTTADDSGGDDSFEVIPGGLSFPDLPVLGNMAGRIWTGNRAIAYRTPSASSLAELTQDDSTIWFSVLYRDTINGTQPDDFAFIFSSQRHKLGGADPSLLTAGDAFGFADIANRIYAVKITNTTAQTLSSGSLDANNSTFLLAGKINWKTNGAPDELFLFNVTDPKGEEPDEGSAFASQMSDFDQSTFDLVSMWDRPNQAARVDEIRFGTTFPEVMGRGSPPLVFTKTASKETVNLDLGPTNLTYTIDIINTTTSAFAGIVVTDSLPAEVSFVSSVPPASHTNGNEYIYEVGTLDAGTNFLISIDVLVTSTVPSVITNTAMASSTNTNVFVTAMDTAETLLYRPTDLAIVKTLSSSLSNLEYTITVTNRSLMNAGNVFVTDTYMPNTTYVTSSLPDVDSGSDYVFDLETLPAGAFTSISLSLVYTSPLPATVTNSASVTTMSIEHDLTDNTNTLISRIGEGVDLFLTKTVNTINLVGGVTNLIYTITVDNIGTTQALSVVVTDTLPAGVSFVSAVPPPTQTNGNEVIFDLGPIGSGSNATVILDAVYTSAAVGVLLVNQASVATPTQELSTVNNTDTAETFVPDPNVDTDGDGMPDAAEIVANTNPLNSNSFLWVEIERTTDNTVRLLRFPASTGRTYRIQTRAELPTAPWSNALTGIPGTNGWIVIPRTNGNDRVYYRIGVEY